MAPTRQRQRQQQKGKALGGIDFKKVKHKVGRKLQLSSNVTKIEVRSKSIILPGQSVSRDKEGLAINNRHQTLKELLTQLTHHNDHVRRDAIVGIKDLLARHPKELSFHAVILVEKLSARIVDVSKSVREVLLDLLRLTIYAGLPQALMRPLVPIVMAYIFSAMTNITSDIRMSAFRFLDAVIQAYPLLTADYVNQVVHYFVNFLGKLGISAQSGSHLPEVLDSLLRFLTAVHARSRLSKMEAANNGGKSIVLALHWYKSILPDATPSLGVTGKDSIALEGTKGDFSVQLADTLVKALLSCWAECSPLVCSGQAPDKDNLECMIKTCQALHVVLLCLEPDLEWETCPDISKNASGSRSQFSDFDAKQLKHQEWIRNCLIPSFCHNLMTCFPIPAPPINLPRKVEELLLSLNICICKVMLSLVIAGDVPIIEEQQTFVRLLNYFEEALNGEMLSSLGLSSRTMDKSLVEFHTKTLVALVPSIFHRISRDRQIPLLQAFTKVFKNCKPTSKLKRVCLYCVGEILQPSYSIRGKGDVTPLTDIFQLQKQWLQDLPKLLWELKHNYPSSSLAVLEVLHHLGRSAPDKSPLSAEYTALQPLLIPFFCVFSPTPKGELYGPFIKLPIECQMLAFDLMYYFDSFSTSFLKAITRCLCLELEPSVVVRCLQVLQAAYYRGSLKISDYLSFLFTLLMQWKGTKMDMTLSSDIDIDVIRQFQRSRVITAIICSCLRQLGDSKLVLHLLKPIILDHLVLDLSPITSYGLIKVVSMLGGIDKGILLPKSLFELLPPFLAKYLVATFMAKSFKNTENNTSMNIFIYPCLHLLSRSARLTESVIQQLCRPSERVGVLHGQVAALLHILGMEHVRNILSLNSVERSFLQRFEGDESGNLHHLEEMELLSMFEKISKASAFAYGWKEVHTN